MLVIILNYDKIIKNTIRLFKMAKSGYAGKRVSVSVKGLTKEIVEILQEQDCNISSVFNKAMLEAIKNPEFIQSIINDEIDSKEKADTLMSVLTARLYGEKGVKLKKAPTPFSSLKHQ